MDALSFYHPGSLESYRQTVALRTESATTEQLREAMISYRRLFEDLTGLGNGLSQPGRDRVAEVRDRATSTSGTGLGDTYDGPAPTYDGPAGTDNGLAAENGNRTADTPR